MKLEITEKELKDLGNNEELIKLNLISKAVYNESLTYEFNEDEKKLIWFNAQNNILELYMRTKVKPRVMVNENSIIDEYNNNKAYFEENKISFENAREMIKERLTEVVNQGLFEDLVKKLIDEMDDKIELSKEDIKFTRGNSDYIKSILLINVLKSNAKKEGFYDEFANDIDLLEKDARLNFYLNKLIELELKVTNEEILEEMQKVSKENFDLVKQYSQEELFNYVGNNLVAYKIDSIRNSIFERIVKENKIDDIVKGYVK